MSTPRRGGRGKRALTREQVISGAYELVQRGGLEALSFPKLAAHLGVAPMTLYTYVEDRQDLIDTLGRRMFREVMEAVPAGEGPWQERVAGVFEVLRHEALTRPAFLSGIQSADVSFGGNIEFMRGLVTVLQEGGLDVHQALKAVLILSSYTVGYITWEAARRDTDYRQDYQRQFERLQLDGHDDFVGALRRELVDVSPEEHFRHGLRRIIAGLVA